MDTEKTSENRIKDRLPRLKTRPDKAPPLKTKPDSSAKTEPDSSAQQTEDGKKRSILKTKPDRKPLLKTKPDRSLTAAEMERRERARVARDRKKMQQKRQRKNKSIRLAVYVLIAVLAVLLIFAAVAIVRRAKISHEERIAEEAYQEEITNSDFYAPSEVLHLSFPVLTLDEAGSGLSVSEFRLILDDLYKKGYMLIDPYSLVQTTKDGFASAEIMVPAGKKPMILSQYDASYDETDTAHAVNLQIDPSGKISAGYLNEGGFLVSGDVDVVPVIEDFIREHADFSYKNARGILGVTGYRGVLGYQVEEAPYEAVTVTIEETEQQKRQREAEEAAAAMYDEYGYLNYGYTDYGYTDYGYTEDYTDYTGDVYTTGDAGDAAGDEFAAALSEGAAGHSGMTFLAGAGPLREKNNTAFLGKLAKTVSDMKVMYIDDDGNLVMTDTGEGGADEADTEGMDAAGDVMDSGETAGTEGADAGETPETGGMDIDGTDTGGADAAGANSTSVESGSAEDGAEALQGDPQIARNRKTAEAVVSALRSEGWRIASGSYGMVSYGSSTEIVTEDAGQWQSVVAPLVGSADMILLPGNADIGQWSGYYENNAKYMLLKEQGFRYYFIGDDEAMTWAQVRPAYVRQGMHMIPDYASYLALMSGSDGTSVQVFETTVTEEDTQEEEQ